MNQEFWKNKNIFITGINGFVGGNLAERALLNGANVFGLQRNTDQRSFLFSSGLEKNILLVNGDIRDKDLLKGFFEEHNIDICFHLAAQVEVGVAAKYPLLTWETNVRGTYVLLEAIREASNNFMAVITASSDKAYGEYPIEDLPYKEDYPLKPRYPYDTSKACADLIAQSYSTELYKLPIAITRFANIYGPGQLNFSALIPDAIRCALGFNNFEARGDGRSIRDFLFVKDVTKLYMAIAEALSIDNSKIRGQVFNAGTGEEKTVSEILEKIYLKLNKKNKFNKILQQFKNNKNPTSEIRSQLMNYDKVENFFGWKPETNFDQGLEQTINWYKKYLNKNK
jgi:CDP-glucose 4,6-dehydratase